MIYYLIESYDGKIDIPSYYDTVEEARDHVQWLENRYPSYKGKFTIVKINDPSAFREDDE